MPRQLDAIFVALKLQLQNRSAICRCDIEGVSNMSETGCNFRATKIALSCHDKNRLCKRASRLEKRKRSEVCFVCRCKVRGCLHDLGAIFIPARVHSGSLLWLCIRLHDTNTKCHAGASHSGASSPRFLSRNEIFIPARKFIPVSCKRGMTVRFISIKVSSILRHYKTRTPSNMALCKHGAFFHLAPE